MLPSRHIGVPSLPPPPLIKSLPPPPLMLSTPEPPQMRSLPPPPLMVCLPLPVATITSAPFVPLIVALLLTMVADLPKHFGTAAFAACVAEKYPSNSDVALTSSRTRRSVLRMTPPSRPTVRPGRVRPLWSSCYHRCFSESRVGGAAKRRLAHGIYDCGM